MVKDAAAVVNYVRQLHPGVALLLCGTSMGGCIALHVSLEVPVDGAVLLAPMVPQQMQAMQQCDENAAM